MDVLILAALEDAVTKINMKDVKTKYIVEMANSPVNQDAYDYLTKSGVIILPDVIANAGGVIVSYLEWLQNKTDQHWPLVKVNAELEKYMVKAVDEVYKTATSQKLSLKEAAIFIALKRLSA